MLLPHSSAFTGCASRSTSPTNWQSWRTNLSTALHLVTLPTVVFYPCRRRDIKTTAVVFCLLSSRSTARLTLQSANGRSQFPVPTCGTTFRSTSAQSLEVFRQRLKTYFFSRSYLEIYLLLFIIIVVCLFSGVSRGPCNAWRYLGHDKRVDDDGDDGDDDDGDDTEEVLIPNLIFSDTGT